MTYFTHKCKYVFNNNGQGDKIMTKEEFENLAGIYTTEEDYAKIEAVYMHIDRWGNDKRQFVKFYNEKGGTEAILMLYNVVQRGLENAALIRQKKREIEELKILYGYEE